jgi:hypothetical protein
MVLGLVLSIALNFVVLGIVFLSGIGKPVVQRIKQRWLYKKGNHVNVIFLGRNHVSHELFLKKEKDGSFLVSDQKYSINPAASFTHDGIPTQINKEGDAEAYNIFGNPEARDMSTAELENIIMSNENDGMAAYIKKMMFWLLIFIGIAVIAASAAAYFGYALNDYIIKKQLLLQSISAAQQAFVNATQSTAAVVGVLPR